MKNPSLLFLWSMISEIIRNSTNNLDVIVDEPGDLQINTNEGRPFVRVRIQRTHVGIYLQPLCYYPEVLPQSLLERKTGKGTLRFRNEEDDLLGEISSLIEACLTLIGHY